MENPEQHEDEQGVDDQLAIAVPWKAAPTHLFTSFTHRQRRPLEWRLE
jgi:hypothetical protein